MLSLIRIVLISPSHAGNIGSAARAMKTMGLTTLYLVNAVDTTPALALAAGAKEVIKAAIHCNTLDNAIQDCRLVIGASSRTRSLQWPTLSPRQCAEQVIKMTAKTQPVALLFGRERCGLTNDELQKCHYHLIIPANPQYSSLNLAMAVQIIVYEIWLAAQTDTAQALKTESSREVVLATAAQLKGLYEHTDAVLHKIKFLDPTHLHAQNIICRLQHIAMRTQLDEKEVNIFRGILTAIERQISLNNSQ